MENRTIEQLIRMILDQDPDPCPLPHTHFLDYLILSANSMVKFHISTRRDLKMMGDQNAMTVNIQRDDRLLSKNDDLSNSRSVNLQEDFERLAVQAEEKLKIRTQIRGKMVGIYRKCLFSLKEGKLPMLPDRIKGDRNRRDYSDESDRKGGRYDIEEEGSDLMELQRDRRRESEDGIHSRLSSTPDDSDVYSHDRDRDMFMNTDYKTFSFTRTMDFNNRHPTADSKGPQEMGSGSGFLGPKVCMWLDNELGALRGAYEGEIRSLESIISDLRILLRQSSDKIIIKKPRNGIADKGRERERERDNAMHSGEFVVRRIDDEKIRGSVNSYIKPTPSHWSFSSTY